MTKQEGKIENNYKIEYFWGFKSNQGLAESNQMFTGSIQHVSEKFRLLFSKANSNYFNAKNREICPQGLDLGGSTAFN